MVKLSPNPGANIRHGSTRVVRYRCSGTGAELTGLVQLPDRSPPVGGWPLVSYGHMTTGGSSWSAPSIGSPEHPEWRRMSQGDALCDALLQEGVAILRPDYPGLGSPGVHPYLVPMPLGQSVVDMVAARHTFDERIGSRWVSAGHSEGSVAAVASSQLVAESGGAQLLGVAAFSPVPRMDLTIGAASRLPVALRGGEVVSALIGLMLSGAATFSAPVAELLAAGHLGESAQQRWNELGQRCLTELSGRDSWGALAPARIASRQLYRALFVALRASDVSLIRPSVPTRVDAGLFDEVAPCWLTTRMVRTWRAQGVSVTHRTWRTHHSGVMNHAPQEAAGWILRRLGAG